MSLTHSELPAAIDKKKKKSTSTSFVTRIQNYLFNKTSCITSFFISFFNFLSVLCIINELCFQQGDAPPMHASWRGEKVKSGGLTVAPCSSNSLTHSMLPAAQASHRGVLPSMLRASTCQGINKPSYIIHACKILVWFDWPYSGDALTCAPALSSRRTHWVCPCIQASCSGVMESTATVLTAAPSSISCWSCLTLPCAAASCTADLSVQNPRPWAAK